MILHHPVRHLPCVLLFSGGLLLGGLLASSAAQVPTAIRPDGTLGTNVSQQGTVYDIAGGTRPGNGPNLFHSFDRFSVGTGDTARFSGPSGIENILSRVTGGQQSVIDGRLQSTIPGANLYLLNPSGVLFGPNATLDVRGSFHVSTADYLRFTDGAKFSANLGRESMLTVAPPAAFGFLGSNPAAIALQGSALQVPAGKGLSVVGGDIEVVGNAFLTSRGIPTLGAPRGRIHLASVASPGEVLFGQLNLAPELQVDSFARLGRLALSQGALVDASGNGGGTVLLRSGRLRVDGSAIFADNTGPLDGAGLGVDLRIAADAVITNVAVLTVDSAGAGRARALRLTAGSLHIDNSVLGSRAFASGDAGNLEVRAEQITLTGSGQIGSSIQGIGRGGDVTVVATDTLSIAGRNREGFRSGLFSTTVGRGDAGRVSVSTPTLTMEDSGTIQAGANRGSSGNAGSVEVRAGRISLSGGGQIQSDTFGAGRGGDVTVVATDALSIAGQDRAGFRSGLFSNTFGRGDAGRLFVSTPTLTMGDGGLIQALAQPGSSGNAGSIEVQAGRISLTGGAQIDSSTRGSGRGGDVTVVATDTLSIAGRDSQGFQSGLFSNTLSSGDAGRLFVSTPTLTMGDGGLIQALAQPGSSGNAGSIEVRAGRISLTGGTQIASGTFGTGRGGDVTVVATDTLSIAGRDNQGIPSGLFGNTLGSGDAGRLFVSTPTLTLEDSGTIQALAQPGSSGNAGSIEVRAGRISLTGGAAIGSSTFGTGRGGSVTVMATDVISIAGRDSQGKPSGIASLTQGRGRGGDIHVEARAIELGNDSIITASSAGDGAAGTIQIQASETFHSQNSAVTTAAARAGGGAIVLRAGRLVQMRNSEISTSVQGGGGDAGNLTLDAPFIAAANSQIIANAFGGQGGNVRIGAQVFLADPESRVSASSTLGIAGTVDIRAPVTNLSGVVAPLTPDFARASELLRDRCAARLHEGTVSSFVVRERASLPATYDSLLPSRLYEPQPQHSPPPGPASRQWSPRLHLRYCS